MKTLVSLLLLVSAVTLCAQQYPEVTIPGSQVRKITSKIVSQQEYELHILVPSGYEKSTKKYPVVYLMDSQWDFPLVNSIYGEQYYDGFIPELIIVGVTWGGENPNPDVLRTRDYTPTNVGGEIATGGADKFLEFIKTELFPFIESNYPASKDNRTLMGCSLGGLFTLYTLFTHTNMFTGYVAASPAVSWDKGVMNKFEKAFSEKQVAKPVRVYATVGDVETGKAYFEEFVGKMTKNAYKNVELQSKVLENTGHSGTKSETYARGLQYIFKRNQLKLSNEILNKYVGTYQFENRDKLEIKNEDNGLKLYFTGFGIPLLADTESKFYATFSLFNVHFKENKKTVEGLDLMTYGRTQTFIRLKE
jgi:predicted alpha/beta superfamily hydrolase